jgi:intraflagellar transport protein 81
MQSKVTAKEREMERLRGPDYKSKGDLREYANALREKSSKYKKVRGMMNDLKDEKAILARTLQLAQQKLEDIEDKLEDKEQKMGVVGFSDAQNKLESISEEKAEVDAEK